MSNTIVKNLSFGSDAKDKVFAGITKLTQAVSSTLGASGKCVILEDNTGKPIITKDLKFNSASAQIEKKKAERNCCSGEDYDIPIKANAICRPAASTLNAKKN